MITSNRAVDEWVALFDDPILANSALDRFAHRANQIVMEGPNLRAARTPTKGGRRATQNAHRKAEYVTDSRILQAAQDLNVTVPLSPAAA